MALVAALAAYEIPTEAPDPLAVERPEQANHYGGPPISLVQFSESGDRVGLIEIEKLLKTPAEWKLILTSKKYYVIYRKGAEVAFTGKVRQDVRRRCPPLCRLQHGALPLRNQVRFRHGMAELPLGHSRREHRHCHRHRPRPAANRSTLSPMRRPPGPHFSRRSTTHLSPLLHQLFRIDLRL